MTEQLNHPRMDISRSTRQKGDASSTPWNFLCFFYFLSWLLVPLETTIPHPTPVKKKAQESSWNTPSQPINTLPLSTITQPEISWISRAFLQALPSRDALLSLLCFTNSYSSFKTHFQWRLYFGDFNPGWMKGLIPDHLTCLLWNLYAGQEATVRTGHGTTDGFQIGKGVRQGCILSPCLFNLYAEYIVRNARLEEAQAGIEIAGRNINNFIYADDTTLMAESE